MKMNLNKMVKVLNEDEIKNFFTEEEIKRFDVDESLQRRLSKLEREKEEWMIEVIMEM